MFLFLVSSSYTSWLRLFLFGWLVAVGFCYWGKLKGGVHVHAQTHTATSFYILGCRSASICQDQLLPCWPGFHLAAQGCFSEVGESAPLRLDGAAVCPQAGRGG